MGLDLTHVQEYRLNKKSGLTEIVRENPAIRLRGDPLEAPIFIQGGQFFVEGGNEIPREKLPSWFWKEAEKVLPEVRAKVGLTLPGEALPTLVVEKPKVAETTKVDGRFCAICQVDIPKKKYGVHIANHTRQALKRTK